MKKWVLMLALCSFAVPVETANAGLFCRHGAGCGWGLLGGRRHGIAKRHARRESRREVRQPGHASDIPFGLLGVRRRVVRRYAERQLRRGC